MPQLQSIRVPKPRGTAENIVILDAIKLAQQAGYESPSDFRVKTIYAEYHVVEFNTP